MVIILDQHESMCQIIIPYKQDDLSDNLCQQDNNLCNNNMTYDIYINKRTWVNKIV